MRTCCCCCWCRRSVGGGGTCALSLCMCNVNTKFIEPLGTHTHSTRCQARHCDVANKKARRPNQLGDCVCQRQTRGLCLLRKPFERLWRRVARFNLVENQLVQLVYGSGHILNLNSMHVHVFFSNFIFSVCHIPECTFISYVRYITEIYRNSSQTHKKTESNSISLVENNKSKDRWIEALHNCYNHSIYFDKRIPNIYVRDWWKLLRTLPLCGLRRSLGRGHHA